MTVAELSVLRPVGTASVIRRIAWTAWWVGLALRVLQLWLSTHPDPHRVFMAFGIGPLTFAAAVVFGMSASTVGLIMASRLPGNRFGWVWVAVGMAEAILATLLLLAADQAAESRLGVVAGLIASVGVALAPFLATAFGLLTFPTGTFIDRRWRIAWLAVLLAIGLRGLEVAFGSPSVFLLPTVANPFLAGPPFGALIRGSQQLGLGVSLVLVTVSACLASVVVRYRRADAVGRRQIRWFLLGASFFVLTLVPAAYIYLVVGTLEERAASIFALNFLGFSLLPITTLVAITHYRLYEIDRIVNRALLYASLTAILAGVFTAGISLAQRIFVAVSGESSDVAIVLTTLVVATLYAPLRKRLEAIVDRRFKFDDARFGAYRDELSRILSMVDPEMAAQRLIDEAIAELGAIGGAVLSASGAATATAGVWPQVLVDRLSIPGGAGGLAAIVIGPRRDGRPHESAQLEELERVAGLVALATRTAQPAPAAIPSTPRGAGMPD